MIDWSVGSYERTAALLDTVSDGVVGHAAIRPGEAVLDVACGTGNAALKAAALGACATGVDLAPRLVEVATQRAIGTGLQVRFVVGDAEALPVQDASVDVLLSVFGLIFAPDQERVAAEVVRVLRPGGRAVITGWVREGALAELGAATARAQSVLAPPPDPAGPPPPGRTPVDWGDEQAVRALFAPHAVGVTFIPATLAFTAASPRAYIEEQSAHHPVWLTARENLGPERYAVLEAELVAILTSSNEDPAALRITSRYLITSLTRD